MADTDFPHINGRARDGASVKIAMLGKRFRGIQSISYADALEVNYIYELGSNAPIAMTDGQYKPEDVAVEVLREYADAIRAAAAAKNLAYGKVPFSVRIHYDDGNTPVLDELFGSRIVKVGNDAKVGPDGLIEKWTLKILRIRRKGLALNER